MHIIIINDSINEREWERINNTNLVRFVFDVHYNTILRVLRRVCYAALLS